MKYIITEQKMNSLIRKYLNESYGDLNWDYYLDEEGNETDCAIVFYDGDYIDGEVKFRLYNECWWVKLEDIVRVKSPVLSFENLNEYESLKGYFGDKWEPVFKDWFFEIYGFKVKTIEY
jgi:hypothetical protein